MPDERLLTKKNIVKITHHIPFDSVYSPGPNEIDFSLNTVMELLKAQLAKADKKLDRPELREKITDILGVDFHPYVAECSMIPIKRELYYKTTDRILALFDAEIKSLCRRCKYEKH